MEPSTRLDPPGFVRIGNDIWIVEADKSESPSTDAGASDTVQPTYALQTPPFIEGKLIEISGLSSYLAGVSGSRTP